LIKIVGGIVKPAGRVAEIGLLSGCFHSTGWCRTSGTGSWGDHPHKIGFDKEGTICADNRFTRRVCPGAASGSGIDFIDLLISKEEEDAR